MLKNKFNRANDDDEFSDDESEQNRKKQISRATKTRQLSEDIKLIMENGDPEGKVWALKIHNDLGNFIVSRSVKDDRRACTVKRLFFSEAETGNLIFLFGLGVNVSEGQTKSIYPATRKCLGVQKNSHKKGNLVAEDFFKLF